MHEFNAFFLSSIILSVSMFEISQCCLSPKSCIISISVKAVIFHLRWSILLLLRLLLHLRLKIILQRVDKIILKSFGWKMLESHASISIAIVRQSKELTIAFNIIDWCHITLNGHFWSIKCMGQCSIYVDKASLMLLD